MSEFNIYKSTPHTLADGEIVRGDSVTPSNAKRVSVIGEYNATPPTYNDGDEVAPQYDVNGYTKATIATKVSNPEDAPVTVHPPVAVVTRITTATTTIISATGVSGWLRLRVQHGTMGAVTVYDNGAGSGTVEYTGTPAAKDVIFGDWVYMSTGCTIVTAAATELLAEFIAQK